MSCETPAAGGDRGLETPASTLKPPNTPEISTSQPETNMLEYALAYAAQGVPIFPCKPDKSPFTRQGFKDATVDAGQILRWWQQWPSVLIATEM